MIWLTESNSCAHVLKVKDEHHELLRPSQEAPRRHRQHNQLPHHLLRDQLLLSVLMIWLEECKHCAHLLKVKDEHHELLRPSQPVLE
jgi:hypothetical protein